MNSWNNQLNIKQFSHFIEIFNMRLIVSKHLIQLLKSHETQTTRGYNKTIEYTLTDEIEIQQSYVLTFIFYFFWWEVMCWKLRSQLINKMNIMRNYWCDNKISCSYSWGNFTTLNETSYIINEKIDMNEETRPTSFQHGEAKKSFTADFVFPSLFSFLSKGKKKKKAFTLYQGWLAFIYTHLDTPQLK